MTSKQIRIPKHCHHKGTNQGYVRLGGRAHYTGVWGLPETNDNYDRLIAEWLAAGRVAAVPAESRAAYTIADLVADYWTYLESAFPNSKEPINIRYALRPAVRIYAEMPAADFRPRHLKAVRQTMIEAGLSRRIINTRIP